MAAPTNTFTSYSSVGTREDLSDVIYDISPVETPVVSAIGRGKASNTKHEWQMDNLSDATNTGALEGDDHSGEAIVPTQRLANYCQIFRKDIVVSGTQRAVDTAGRADELEYQIIKKGKEMKRDIEKAILGPYAATVGATGSARMLAGMESWLGSASVNGLNYNHVSKQSSATAATTPGFVSSTGLVTDAPTDATAQGAITEADLKSVIKQAWDNGGDPRMVVVGSSNKQTISGFSGIAQLQHTVSGTDAAIITGAADVYKSDFGAHRIVPTRQTRDQTVMVLDTDQWGIDELRPMQTVEVAKTGDSDKRMFLTEMTLRCNNPFANGKVADCETS